MLVCLGAAEAALISDAGIKAISNFHARFARSLNGVHPMIGLFIPFLGNPGLNVFMLRVSDDGGFFYVKEAESIG